VADFLEPSPYTTPEEVRDFLTTNGVDLRTLELPETTGATPLDTVLSKCNAATSHVRFYLNNAAHTSTLAQIPWVRYCAKVFACLLLTGHAGEAMNGTFVTLWEWCEKQLLLVLNNQAEIPGLPDVLPNDPGSSPQVWIPRIDIQRTAAVRLVQKASTSRPTGYPVPTDPRTNLTGWPYS
jgi:hypothetical protein